MRSVQFVLTIFILAVVSSQGLASQSKFYEELVDGSAAQSMFAKGNLVIKADGKELSNLAASKFKIDPSSISVFILSEIRSLTLDNNRTAECMEFKGFAKKVNIPSNYSCRIKTAI